MKKTTICFLLLLAILFSTRLLRLSFPKTLYFDEVYHGYTAGQMLHSNKDVYDPWAKPPEGRANEWTHPPLAKLIMALFMIPAESSFNWRLGSVFFGSAVVGLTSLLAWILFSDILISVLVFFFLTFENLLLTQSRIAMNDVYFMAFALTAFCFYAKWRIQLIESIQQKPKHRKTLSKRNLVLCGVGLGLAVSCKWTALYAIGLLGLDGLFVFFDSKKVRTTFKNEFQMFLYGLGVFVFIPGAIYLASYIQYFLMGYNWEQFKELQWQMWHYHSHLKATHSYQSQPWQWLFNLRPVWMHVEYLDGDRQRHIYNVGNSVVLLSGLAAVSVLCFQFKKWVSIEPRFRWAMFFVLGSYFVFWAPWIVSPRIMLFYHYLPAVPFLVIALSYITARALVPKRAVLFYTLLALTVIAFFLIYPYNTGVSFSRSLLENSYFKIPYWR